MKFKCISGLSLVRQESVLAVADTGLQCLHIVRCIRKLKSFLKVVLLCKLNLYSNLLLQDCTVNIPDCALLICGLSEVKDGLFLMADVFAHSDLMIQKTPGYHQSSPPPLPNITSTITKHHHH